MADLSGTITSGGNAQTIAATNPQRRGIIIQNVSDTDMWVRFGGTAAASQPSFLVRAGDTLTLGSDFRTLTSQAISVFGATTGKAFVAHDTNS